MSLFSVIDAASFHYASLYYTFWGLLLDFVIGGKQDVLKYVKSFSSCELKLTFLSSEEISTESQFYVEAMHGCFPSVNMAAFCGLKISHNQRIGYIKLLLASNCFKSDTLTQVWF